VVVKSGQGRHQGAAGHRGGQGPDLDISPISPPPPSPPPPPPPPPDTPESSDHSGGFCIWRYIARDRSTLAQFPQNVKDYTEFNGKRLAMPLLSDTLCLYYNNTLLAPRRLHRTAEAMGELATDGQKLTKLKSDGVKWRLRDHQRLYEERTAHYAPRRGELVTSQGTSASGTDPTGSRT